MLTENPFLYYHFLNSASVVEESFDYLDAPVERVSNADVPVPYATNLERMSGPQVQELDITRSILKYI